MTKRKNGDFELFGRVNIPANSDPAVYIANRINKEMVTVVFEKHNFVFSDSCSEKSILTKEIENRGGRIRKSIGNTTHYVILGKNIKGDDRIACKTIAFNMQAERSIEAVTEEELLALCSHSAIHSNQSASISHEDEKLIIEGNQ